MKGKHKKWFFLALCLVFLVMAIAYYLVEKEVYEGTGKTKLGKEILVAKDQGRGGQTYPERWCGTRGVLNEGDNIGIEFIDFVTKERIQISPNPHDTAIGCSPDGRWALYSDSKTKQYDKSYEYIEGVFEGWMGEVADIYRYEISTGKKERVATVRREGAYEAISPDGKEILLGTKHSFSLKVAVPQWKGLWLSNEWIKEDAVWFPDSSGVALWDQLPNRICVEFFGKNGWANCFVLGPEVKGKMSGLTIDRENTIYFTGLEDTNPTTGRGIYLLYRCRVKNKELFCERIVELDRIIYPGLDFLPDGDIIFEDYEKNCIRRALSGQKKARCIIDNAHLIGVSADGKRLAYERSKIITKLDGEFSHHQYDLFVRELYNK